MKTINDDKHDKYAKLPPCTYALNPEMARNDEIDEPCDDNRG